MAEYPEECPECGRVRLWAGSGWRPHTDRDHERTRRRLLRALRGLLAREGLVRLEALYTATQGLVLVVNRSRVHRWMYVYSEVPAELWDDMGSEVMLKQIRAGASDWAKTHHGIVVNPATWRQRVIDDVVR